MRLVRVGLASLDPVVGAVRSNTDAVVDAVRRMADDDVTVACFPEQVLGGYPPEDLVQWRGFIDAQRTALDRIADETADLPTVVVVGAIVGVGGQLFNVAAVIHGGRVLGLVPKERLPTYEVFYEARTLARGSPGLELESDGVPIGDMLFEFDFGTLAVEVCEDIWTPTGPMRRRCLSGAELVVNISASPYRVGVADTRREMLATRSSDNVAALAYVNRVGSQDGLVFDGGGMVFDNGRPRLDTPRFETGVWTCDVDLDRTVRLRRENSTWRADQEAFQRAHPQVAVVRSDAPTADRSGIPYPSPPSETYFLPAAREPGRSARETVLDDLFEALAVGVQGYYQKTGAFEGLGVPLSGGRDSVLTLIVAWHARTRILDAGGSAWLRAFYMPSRYSNKDTREAARRICEDLDVELVEVPIDDALEEELDATEAMLGGAEPSDLTRQNIQARIRGARMWNWANSAGGLFLQAGDMSERAVGYTTIGGDLEGGLGVLANVPKTVVIALLEHLLERFDLDGIRATLETEPGPELAPDQAAEDELMPFDVLDACLHLYAAEKLAPSEIARVLPDVFPDRDATQLASWAERFAELFDRSIYKWVQAPISLHVGRIDLERERALQLPVLQRNEWDDPATES